MSRPADDRSELLGDPFENLDAYLELTSILPNEVKAQVDRYLDPLTGERRQSHYDNHVVLAEIRHLHEYLGRVPTSKDIEGYGEISLAIYRDRFGTVPRAVEVAGFGPEFVSAQEKFRYLAKYEELVDPDEQTWKNCVNRESWTRFFISRVIL